MIIDKTGNPLTKALVAAAVVLVDVVFDLVTFLHFLVVASYVQSAFKSVASQVSLVRQAVHLVLAHLLKVHLSLAYSQ